MTKSMKLCLAAVLMLAPLFTACERADDISSVTMDAPRYSEGSTQREARPVKKLSDDTTTTYGLMVTPSVGGTITIGQYQLFIPEGAVSQPTTFYMTTVTGEFIKVRLRAFNNDGEVTQFLTPLTLTLPYSDAAAEDVADPFSLRIANVSEDGLNTILELIGVSVDTVQQTVTGNISHFSDYIVAKEIIIGID